MEFLDPTESSNDEIEESQANQVQTAIDVSDDTAEGQQPLLETPLPPGWHAAATEDGSVYYWSDAGGHQWERPQLVDAPPSPTQPSEQEEGVSESVLSAAGLDTLNLTGLDRQTLAVMRKTASFIQGNVREVMLPLLQRREVPCARPPRKPQAVPRCADPTLTTWNGRLTTRRWDFWRRVTPCTPCSCGF